MSRSKGGGNACNVQQYKELPLKGFHVLNVPF